MHATGNIRALGTITQTSDIRLKQNISQIDFALQLIKNLRGVYYTKKDDLRKQKHIGLIAQEVEEYLPEVVWTDSISEEKTKSVSYDNIVSVLVEAIKELRSKVNRLQSRINLLLSKTTDT
jgi:rubrerythrin